MGYNFIDSNYQKIWRSSTSYKFTDSETFFFEKNIKIVLPFHATVLQNILLCCFRFKNNIECKWFQGTFVFINLKQMKNNDTK